MATNAELRTLQPAQTPKPTAAIHRTRSMKRLRPIIRVLLFTCAILAFGPLGRAQTRKGTLAGSAFICSPKEIKSAKAGAPLEFYEKKAEYLNGLKSQSYPKLMGMESLNDKERLGLYRKFDSLAEGYAACSISGKSDAKPGYDAARSVIASTYTFKSQGKAITDTAIDGFALNWGGDDTVASSLKSLNAEDWKPRRAMPVTRPLQEC